MGEVYYINGDTLFNIAESLRNKTNTIDKIKPSNMSKMISYFVFTVISLFSITSST